MTEREQKIRELIARLTKPESGVSREFNALSVSDTEFLLQTISELRMRIEAPF